MYCIHCGTKLREGAKFCPSCGKPVTASKRTAEPSAAPANKTSVKTEIKEKAADLAKSGAKQILAALKDQDISAPSTVGEVRCKTDQAQSAFMKLLKKGILPLLALLVFLPARAEEFPGGDGFNGLNISYSISGGQVTDIDDRDGFTRCRQITGTCSTGKVTISGTIGSSWSPVVTVKVSISNGEKSDEQTFTMQKTDNSKSYSVSIPVAKSTREVSFRIDVGASYGNGQSRGLVVYGYLENTKYNANATNEQSRADVSKTTKGKSKSYDTEGIDGIVSIDSAADEESGENGWIVPAAVVGGLAAGGIALKNRKKKKSANKSDNKEDTDNGQDKEDEEEKAIYEMRIRKDFGDTLTPGEEPQKVCARIVRIPADGKAATDTALTAKISISGDEYLHVSGQGLEGEYMSAYVEAPQTSDIPSEAVVNFRLAGAGGSFTNRMHFKIAKSEIVFFQENITLPACSDEVWRLPFAVTGASKDTVVEACSNCLNKYDVKVEPGEKDGLYYAVISEKAKDKKEPGTWEPFSLGIKASNGKTEMSDSIPLYRFHMGLRFNPHSTIPCYLNTSATGKMEVAKAMAELVYFDWDPETNDIVTVFPVPTDFKISAAGETEQGYLEKLGITCKPTSITTDNGRRLEIYPVKGILDAPSRFNATITLTADCGQGHTETVTKEVLIASQPVRQNVTSAMLAEDKRIGEGLLNIQKSIWDHGEYARLFPLHKLIDVMIDGYDGAYGYDKHQVETVKDVYKRFLSGDLAGANATAQKVTLADEMALYIDSFLQTSEEVENSMGFFTRMAVGVVTLGMSDVVFTSLQVARDMKATVEKGGGVYDVLVVGVKAAAVEALTDFDVWKAVGKKVAPKQFAAAAKSVENLKNQAKEAASNYFSETIGKKTKGVLEKSKSVKSKAASKADDAIDAFRKNPEMSDLDKKLDQVYKNGQAHGKAKVNDLQTAQWLMEANPTPENVKLYKKKVLEVQRDKFAMHQLNNLPDGNSTRAAFNKELENVYKDVDDDVRRILKKQGYELDEKPFAATSSNKADLIEGKKVTFDRDVTYKTIDGKDVPQKIADEAYEEAFYKRTTGIDKPSKEVAHEWAQMHDQSVVQKGSKISYEEDLNPVIKDWDQKLTNAEHTGNVMTYKSTEWFKQTNEMIKKANTLETKGLRLEMLEQALSKRQEAARQMVKQFRYVHERDLAAQTKGAVSKITERMRYGMEVSSRLFSKGADQLTLGETEAILAKENITLELLSSWLGDTLKAIG